MSLPAITLRGDLTGTAFGGSPTWTDYTSSLETGADGEPITITWGKQDEDSAPQPRRCTFTLDNTDGRFTTGASIITTAHQFNVRVTVSATTYDRFTGYVEDVEVVFPGAAHSQVKVTCVDISGRLSESRPIRAMYDEEVLADSPRFFYSLTEEMGVAGAGDLTNTGPPLVVTNSKYGAGKCDFGVEGALWDRTGVEFDSDDNIGANTTTAMTVLKATPGAGHASMPPTSGGFTLEMVCGPLTAPPSGGFTSYAVTLISPDAAAGAAYFYYTSTGIARFVVGDGVDSASITLTTQLAKLTDGRRHHVLATLASDYRTAKLYVDGVQYGTDIAGAAVDVSKYTDILVGGVILNSTYPAAFTVRGVISGVALTSGVLSDARIAAHAAAALGTGPSERSDQRFTRLLGYAGLTTSGLPTGQAVMGGQRTAGVQLVEALEKVAVTEGTHAFVTGTGLPAFQARHARYWPTSSFTLAASDIDPGVTVRKDRLGLVNDQTATRDGGAAQRVTDSSSITSYGRRDGGALEVAPSTDFDALQNAAWRVENGASPVTRLSTLHLDLTTMETTGLLQSVLTATISTPFSLSGQPSQTPSALTAAGTGLFVEGATERLGVTSWDIDLFTSPLSASGVSFAAGGSTPNLPNTLRADASPSQRTKLDAGLKIPF